MKRQNLKVFSAFLLGMLVFSGGRFLVSAFVFVDRPQPSGIIEDWGRICFWPDEGKIYAAVSPKGCHSPTCITPKMQTGTAIVDRQAYKIQLETRFVLVETSHFLLLCVDDCSGGGSVNFVLDNLTPNDYEVWFGDEKVGEVVIFSGRETPRQCFENEG